MLEFATQHPNRITARWASLNLAWQITFAISALLTVLIGGIGFLVFVFPFNAGNMALAMGFLLVTATFFTRIIAERLITDQPSTDHAADVSKQALPVVMESSSVARKPSHTDSLTNLPTRDALRQCVDAAAARGVNCALLQLDIARLARINEALGNDVGDQTLVHTAHRLLRIVRNRMATEKNTLASHEKTDPHIESILLGRLSGDQFGIVILGSIDDATVNEFSRSLANSFTEPFHIEGHIFSLGCRIGMTIAREQHYDFTMLLNTTAISLAEAKRIGRIIHKSELTDLRGQAYKDLIVEQELRHALKRQEFEVFYQPQVNLKNGQIIGAEALIRWMHPERGLLSPAHFIDLAEEAGLLSSIGNYVLEAICSQSVIWAASGFHPKLSMNISASHCRNEYFAKDLLAIIANNHAQANQFEIEITETVAMQDVEHAVQELTPLREAGLRLAVDDFGTGYSNLAALSRLPFDVLKIDRGFVMGCEKDKAARTMVSTILRMAQNLGYETVAEGVETEEQRLFLFQQECAIGQGYFFGKPMPADKFTQHYIDFTTNAAQKLKEIIHKENTIKESPGLIISSAAS